MWAEIIPIINLFSWLIYYRCISLLLSWGIPSLAWTAVGLFECTPRLGIWKFQWVNIRKCPLYVQETSECIALTLNQTGQAYTRVFRPLLKTPSLRSPILRFLIWKSTIFIILFCFFLNMIKWWYLQAIGHDCKEDS